MSERASEFDLINAHFAPLSAGAAGAFNLTDDAAIIKPHQGLSLVVTTDALVEGVHFFAADSAADIAAKLVRVSLSDLASMGATAAYYNLALAVPPRFSDTWFEQFSQSLAREQNEFGITLIGGDTVSTTGPLTLTLTAMGYVAPDKELRRSGAQIGDDVWVSGTIGDGALGLLAAKGELAGLSPQDEAFLLGRYRRPNPRLKLAASLIDHARSAIDISDGLIADLGHICTTSKVGAEILMTEIPLAPAVARIIEEKPELFDLILGGGDDYELLFTADSSFTEVAQAISETTKTRLTKIGTITPAPLIRIFDQNNNEYALTKNGFTHF